MYHVRYSWNAVISVVNPMQNGWQTERHITYLVSLRQRNSGLELRGKYCMSHHFPLLAAHAAAVVPHISACAVVMGLGSEALPFQRSHDLQIPISRSPDLDAPDLDDHISQSYSCIKHNTEPLQVIPDKEVSPDVGTANRSTIVRLETNNHLQHLRAGPTRCTDRMCCPFPSPCVRC